MLIDKVKDNVIKKDLKLRKFNSIFKRKKYSLEPRKTKKNFSKIEVDNFVIKIADKNSELRKAQALRYSVFYKEKKALEEEQKRAEEIKTEENLDNKSKSKSCSCC